MNSMIAAVSALLADGVYVGWGALVVILIIFLVYLLFFRGR